MAATVEDQAPGIAAATALDPDGDGDGGDCCVICLEAITAPCEAAPCGHVLFDLFCVRAWLDLHPTCPLCKTPVVRVLHGPRCADVGGPDRRAYTAIQNPAAAGLRRWFGWHETTAAAAMERMQSSRSRPPQPRPREPRAVVVRRDVYRNNLYSMHVGSNPVSRYRELTTAMFRHDEQLLSRARVFIRRELRVFSFLSDHTPSPPPPERIVTATATRRRAPNAEFLLEFIVAMLKSVDVVGSMGAARDTLADYLGKDFATLFLHELRSWLRSPYERLEEWDRVVQYPPLPGVEVRLMRQRSEPSPQQQEPSN